MAKVVELIGKVVKVEGGTATLEFKPNPWFYKLYILKGGELEKGKCYLVKVEKIGPSIVPMYKVIEAKKLAYDINELPILEAEISKGFDSDGYPVEEVDYFKCPHCGRPVQADDEEIQFRVTGEDYDIEIYKCPHCGGLYKAYTEYPKEGLRPFPITFEINITGYKVKGKNYARINLPPEFSPLIGKKAKLIPISPREFKLVIEEGTDETIKVHIQRVKSETLRKKLVEIALEAGPLFEKLPSWADLEAVHAPQEKRPYSWVKHMIQVLEDLADFDRAFHVDISKDIVKEMDPEQLIKLGISIELAEKEELTDDEATKIVEMVWGETLDKLEILHEQLIRLLERHKLRVEDIEDILF